MGTHVWGAGGSRRGRRISMDNPIISPWMQNTSVPASSNQTSTFLQSMIRFPGPIPDRNMSIQVNNNSKYQKIHFVAAFFTLIILKSSISTFREYIF